MTPSDAVGLANLQEALSGKKPGEQGDSQHPKFAGFCLFGGTRMVRKDDPTVIVPGVTEVPPDEIVAACQMAFESINRSLVSIVPLGDSKALREALLARGFLS
jgi:hypothetical protein